MSNYGVCLKHVVAATNKVCVGCRKPLQLGDECYFFHVYRGTQSGQSAYLHVGCFDVFGIDKGIHVSKSDCFLCGEGEDKEAGLVHYVVVDNTSCKRWHYHKSCLKARALRDDERSAPEKVQKLLDIQKMLEEVGNKKFVERVVSGEIAGKLKYNAECFQPTFLWSGKKPYRGVSVQIYLPNDSIAFGMGCEVRFKGKRTFNISLSPTKEARAFLFQAFGADNLARATNPQLYSSETCKHFFSPILKGLRHGHSNSKQSEVGGSEKVAI